LGGERWGGVGREGKERGGGGGGNGVYARVEGTGAMAVGWSRRPTS